MGIMSDVEAAIWCSPRRKEKGMERPIWHSNTGPENAILLAYYTKDSDTAFEVAKRLNECGFNGSVELSNGSYTVKIVVQLPHEQRMVGARELINLRTTIENKERELIRLRQEFADWKLKMNVVD